MAPPGSSKALANIVSGSAASLRPPIVCSVGRDDHQLCFGGAASALLTVATPVVDPARDNDRGGTNRHGVRNLERRLVGAVAADLDHAEHHGVLSSWSD